MRIGTTARSRTTPATTPRPFCRSSSYASDCLYHPHKLADVRLLCNAHRRPAPCVPFSEQGFAGCQADIENCRKYAAEHPGSYGPVKIQASYAACMMIAGHSVQFPDGSIRSQRDFAGNPTVRAGGPPSQGQASLNSGAPTTFKIIPPPGKSQETLDSEASTCRNNMSTTAALYAGSAIYVRCMRDFGNAAQLSDGTTLQAAPRYSPNMSEQPPMDTAAPATPQPQTTQSGNRSRQGSEVVNCTTTHGFGGDYTACDNGTQSTTQHGAAGDYTTSGGRTSTTVHGLAGDYTTGGGRSCTTSHGFGGDYTTCDDGMKCTTSHGYAGDYTTCTRSRE